MRRGTRYIAAGTPTPGTPPFLVRALPTYFPQPTCLISVFLRTISNRHTMQSNFAELAKVTLWNASGMTKGCALLSPTRALAISNRHMMRLEVTATRANSTRSLFLIVPSRRICTNTQGELSRSLLQQASPACIRSQPQTEHSISISNRHLVRLGIDASPSESTRSLFLIVPNRPHFHTESLARRVSSDGHLPQFRSLGWN